ncbi:MAG: inositol monophosphatase [Dehalococcoidia bacterium]|nr:inositol monophosphatase [Dehalococcoidia bacterium]
MAVPGSLTGRVELILRGTAEAVILPRFRRLAAGDVSEKSPGEVVTVVDREAELAIAPRLAELVRGSRVCGEEAAAATPALLDDMGAGYVWLLDPLDGTANFVAGAGDFAVMAALLRDGTAVAAWILEPVSGRLCVAELGAGARLDGVALCVPGPPAAGELRGALHTRYMPAGVRANVEAAAGRLGEASSGAGCAGVEYRETIEGARDFSLYWRTLPWDHIPGALILSEAGGQVARLDGSPYRPGDGRTGLLAASSPAAWELARAALPSAL